MTLGFPKLHIFRQHVEEPASITCLNPFMAKTNFQLIIFSSTKYHSSPTMADHNAESLTSLRTTDTAIANLAYDVYGKAASDEQIERAKKALEAKTHKVSVVATKQEAVELLAKSIPSGASVMNAGSRTLVMCLLSSKTEKIY